MLTSCHDHDRMDLAWQFKFKQIMLVLDRTRYCRYLELCCPSGAEKLICDPIWVAINLKEMTANKTSEGDRNHGISMVRRHWEDLVFKLDKLARLGAQDLENEKNGDSSSSECGMNLTHNHVITPHNRCRLFISGDSCLRLGSNSPAE